VNRHIVVERAVLQMQRALRGYLGRRRVRFTDLTDASQLYCMTLTACDTGSSTSLPS
jgi:hypothetical protein